MKKLKRIISALMAIIVLTTVIPVNEAKAETDNSWEKEGSINWKLSDDQKILYISKSDSSDSPSFSEYSVPGWKEYSENIQKIYITSSSICKLENIDYYFSNMHSLKYVEGFPLEAVSACHTFENCKNLISVKYDNYSNTYNLKDADHMFNECRSLTDFNLDSCTKLENAEAMFKNCSSYSEDAKVSSTLKNTTSMFEGTNVSKITFDESNKNTLKDPISMFKNCIKLEDIGTINLYGDCSDAFADCSNLSGTFVFDKKCSGIKYTFDNAGKYNSIIIDNTNLPYDTSKELNYGIEDSNTIINPMFSIDDDRFKNDTISGYSYKIDDIWFRSLNNSTDFEISGTSDELCSLEFNEDSNKFVLTPGTSEASGVITIKQIGSGHYCDSIYEFTYTNKPVIKATYERISNSAHNEFTVNLSTGILLNQPKSYKIYQKGNEQDAVIGSIDSDNIDYFGISNCAYYSIQLKDFEGSDYCIKLVDENGTESNEIPLELKNNNSYERLVINDYVTSNTAVNKFNVSVYFKSNHDLAGYYLYEENASSGYGDYIESFTIGADGSLSIDLTKEGNYTIRLKNSYGTISEPINVELVNSSKFSYITINSINFENYNNMYNTFILDLTDVSSEYSLSKLYYNSKNTINRAQSMYLNGSLYPVVAFDGTGTRYIWLEDEKGTVSEPFSIYLVNNITKDDETTTSAQEITTGSSEEITTKKYEEATTKKLEEATTKKLEEATTKKYEEATTKKYEEATTKKYEEATTKKYEEATTKKHEEATTKKLEETTTKVSEETTTKKHEEETTKKTTTTSKSKQKITVKNPKNIIKGKTSSLSTKVLGGAKITYKSLNTKIATINSKGKITAKNYGQVTIKISTKETAKYKSGSKTIKIKVIPNKPSAPTITTKNTKTNLVCSMNYKVDGLEILYKKSGSKKYTTLKVNCKKSSKYTKDISKLLEKNKSLYVKYRTFVKVGKTKYYSSYSNEKLFKHSQTLQRLTLSKEYKDHYAAAIDTDAIIVKKNDKLGLETFSGKTILAAQFDGYQCYDAEYGLVIFYKDTGKKREYDSREIYEYYLYNSKGKCLYTISTIEPHDGVYSNEYNLTNLFIADGITYISQFDGDRESKFIFINSKGKKIKEGNTSVDKGYKWLKAIGSQKYAWLCGEDSTWGINKKQISSIEKTGTPTWIRGNYVFLRKYDYATGLVFKVTLSVYNIKTKKITSVYSKSYSNGISRSEIKLNYSVVGDNISISTDDDKTWNLYTVNGKKISKRAYSDIEYTTKNKKYYLVADTKGNYYYIDKNGKEYKKDLKNAGKFMNGKAIVLDKTGKCYLVNEDFKQISESFKADSVATMSSKVFTYTKKDKRYFVKAK